MPQLPQDQTRQRPLERLVAWWHGKNKKGASKRIAHLKSKPVKNALEAASIAEATGDADAMVGCSYKLLRQGLFERAWQLRAGAAKLTQLSSIPDWDGGDLAGKTILVRPYAPRDRVGEELRLARFIAPVARKASRCIVLSEPRLVPLLARSFPGVDVRPRGVDDATVFAEADFGAYYETIAFHTAKTAEEMRRSFVPVRADATLAKRLRQRFKVKPDGPLIGIAWWSSNSDKALPDLQSWAPLLGWSSATFVSLQYGDTKHDLDVLRELTGCRVIQDTQIDQLTDLDGFAAQITALDAVVSISNTTIDMAGMLAVPTFHIRGEKASAIWPQSGSSPWYPGMNFLYKAQRPWSAVFADARSDLEQMFSTGR